MKVSNINNVFFKGNNYISTPVNNTSNSNTKEIRELDNITPDYNIKVPTKYTKINEQEIGNGLKIYNYKLSNGHNVSIIPMKDSPAVVKNYVNVGSMNEPAKIKGISHFLEHMAFNGTNGENGHLKLKVGDSFKKIEALGGWANASTNYAITDFVNSTPLLDKNDVEKQIKIIAAMTEDLQLANNMIEKEKHPVCSEINMILDDSKTIALDQSVRTLFNVKNPTDELVGGSVESIKNLTQKDVKDYYDKYYTPNNMNLVITGDVDPEKIINIVAKNFNSHKASKGEKFEEKLNPIQKTIRKDFINDKTNSTDIIVSFAGPKRNDARNQIINDLAKIYLKSHQVGLINDLKKYNTSPYISNENISTNTNYPMMNYIATTTSEENSEAVLKNIFTNLSQIKKPSEEDLAIIKEKVLNNRDNAFEYSNTVNDTVGVMMLNKTPEILTDYDKIVKSITPDDLYNSIKEFYDIKKAAITVVHPKKNKNITFQGKTRKPINIEDIQEKTLSNNYNIGLYNTKSSNLVYNIKLFTDTPYNKKPGVIEVLNEIYSMGTIDEDEENFAKYNEKKNIAIIGSITPRSLEIYSNSSPEKQDLILKRTKKLLYNPRITEDNLLIAKKNIKDYLLRQKNDASALYENYDSQHNQYSFSDKEILENIDNITLDDVIDCHKYFINNTRGIITANIPNSSHTIQQKIIDESSKLKSVLPNVVKEINVYTPNIKPVVLTESSTNSQADIKQIYKFKTNNSIKENISQMLANSILTSSSIGLFDNLREKEHLAYSVYSSQTKQGDNGTISCNILTTTDNKEIQEYSYDNLQKSIDGFNKQIKALINSEFTDQDFNNAKLALKASLLENEGTSNKLSNLSTGLNSKYGITYCNQLYDEIDNITREDIVLEAKKMFKNPPIYSIVASQDTLDYNKEFLKNLENK